MPQKAIKIYFRLLLLFFFVQIPQMTAQKTEGPTVLLTEALQRIQTTYGVRFSFADEEINTLTVTPPDLNTTLDSILDSISGQTLLVFEKIADGQYTIARRQSLSVCAVLKDRRTGEPISGASIESGSSRLATISDDTGRFELRGVRPGTILKIRFLGYETYYINVEKLFKAPCEALYLSWRFEALHEVVVQKFLTTGLQKQNDGSFVFHVKDFGILPGQAEPDLLQTIQALPGIESFNETVSNINIRGGTNDQNLLLWDGIKMYQSGHFFGLISAYNPYLTEQVTVTKNGTDAAYNDGVSGTIDMLTYNQVGEKAFGGAGFNLISADAYGHVPISSKFAIQASVRRSITDQFQTPTYNQFFDRAFQDSKITDTRDQEIDQDVSRQEDFYFYDGQLKLLYDFHKKHKVRVSLIAMNNHLDYEETLADPDTVPETKRSNLDQKNYAFGGGLFSNWTSSFSTSVEGYYTHYKLDASNQALLTDQVLMLNNEVLETGMKLNTRWVLNKQLTLQNGYQFYEVGITNTEDVNDPAFFSKTKGVVRGHSIFSEGLYQTVNRTTSAKGGVRINYLEKFGVVIIEPRLSLHQKLAENFSLELQGEMKSQVTNQIINLERDFLGVEKRRWVLSDNKEIPITKSRQISLGFHYNQSSFYAGLEGFYKKVKGITTFSQGFQNQNQFQKTSGSYAVHGIEFLVNKKTSKYSTWLSYTYSKNDYTFDALTPSRFPNNLDIRHSVSFAATYTPERFKFAVGLNYRTGKPYSSPQEGNEVSQSSTGNSINYDSPNNENLSDYLRMDFSSSYRFQISDGVNGSLGIAVLNVLNKKNPLDIYYRLEDSQSTEVQKVENVSLGITPNASLRIFF